MNKYITVNVQRAKAASTAPPALTDIGLQLDNVPLSEVLYYDGVATVERFTAFAMNGIYDIWQTDILTDISNVDPVTSTNTQYRVITIPEAFPDNHMEFTIDLYRGGA